MNDKPREVTLTELMLAGKTIMDTDKYPRLRGTIGNVWKRIIENI